MSVFVLFSHHIFRSVTVRSHRRKCSDRHHCGLYHSFMILLTVWKKRFRLFLMLGPLCTHLDIRPPVCLQFHLFKLFLLFSAVCIQNWLTFDPSGMFSTANFTCSRPTESNCIVCNESMCQHTQYMFLCNILIHSTKIITTGSKNSLFLFQLLTAFSLWLSSIDDYQGTEMLKTSHLCK